MDPVLTSSRRPVLSTEHVRTLQRQSDFRSWLEIFCTYISIIGLVALCTWKPIVPCFILAFVLIGALQHRLSIILHEAVHYLLFRHRPMNNIVGNLLLAYPIGFTMHYRVIHFAHHADLGEDNDPDLVNYESFPNTAAFFFAMFMKNITGFNALKQFLEMIGLRAPSDPHLIAANIPRPSKWHIVGLALTQILILGLFSMFSSWWFYFLLWLAPLVTVAKTCSNIRNAVEHTALVPDPKAPFARYRTIHSSLLERFFLAPLHFNYHAEHHLYPGIPHHQLPVMHELLRHQDSYAQNIQQVPGYMHFVRRYMIRKK